MDQNIYEILRHKAENEPYANKMGIRVIKIEDGYSLVEMKMTEEMENIFGMIHGGAIFSLIDAAFELAGNTQGVVSVALNMNITYIKPAKAGETLRAEAKEVASAGRTASYDIQITNDDNEVIALCQALLYRKRDRFV